MTTKPPAPAEEGRRLLAEWKAQPIYACARCGVGHSDGYYNGLAKIIKLAEDAQEVQRLRDSQPAPATRTRKPRKETR